jgi:flagellar biosynthetic protein FliR
MELTLYGVNIWAAALVFARVGAMMATLPGFSEPAVSPRFRLGLALALTVLLAPLIAPGLPQAPSDAWLAGQLIMTEVIIGLTIGVLARLLFTALATAGQVFGIETGLAFAQTADPTMSQTGQIFSVFLSIMGVALIFATDLHHVFLAGISRSYDTFVPGEPLMLGDAAEIATSLVSQSFLIGVQIAAPIILAGLIFRVGLGVLARLAPTIQVFFVTMPLSVLGGLIIMALGLSAGMIVWLDALQSHVGRFP